MLVIINKIKEKYPFIFQFFRFFLVGLLNTAIDFGVLNSLIFISGRASGIYYPIFKSISFLFAVTNSYFMNKHWTFKSSEQDNAGEFLKFVSVNLVGWGLNVGTASYVVNVIGVPEGFSPVLWANLGAVSATAITLFWNFIGMKFLVFKR